MEVASPLTAAHASARAKRPMSCSPGLVEVTNRSSFPSGMDLSDDSSSMQRAFKRRRFHADSSAMDSTDASVEYPPFMNMTFQKSKTMFASSGASMKRCRQDALSPVQSHENLERVVESQANEIEVLKNAKANLETSLSNLKSEHDKTLNENRILKRAVTIQQERQNQAANDLEAARQFKVSAEENIRRLEQMILSLRYHLQAQQPNAGNDFMGFPPQPPDVY